MTDSKYKILAIISLPISVYVILMFVCYWISPIENLPDWLRPAVNFISLSFMGRIFQPLFIMTGIGIIGLILAVIGKKSADKQGIKSNLAKISAILGIIAVTLGPLSLIMLVIGVLVIGMPIEP